MIDADIRVKIRHYFFAEHWKIGTIAAEFQVHPDTVRRAIEAEKFQNTVPVRASLLEPYLPFVHETLEAHPRLRITRLHRMLTDRGYRGSIRQLRRSVASVRPHPQEAFLRTQVYAGEQAQVDWAHFGAVMVGRARRTLSCFVMTLSWSRALYLEFFFDQTMESFLRGHVHAFASFAGSARVLLYDFVPRHKIVFLFPAPLCGCWRIGARKSRRRAFGRAHNDHKELSHVSNSWSFLHLLFRRHTSEVSIGGRQATTAACFVLSVISA